ncbi:MAG: tetratricopeptide repeat protein [Anaerolineae bacterium]|nr:tetratricopeptide repeat protein [Anaerolineae bacterium]
MAVKTKRERRSAPQAPSSGAVNETQATQTPPTGYPWSEALLEAGWLGAAVVTPLVFSSYSPRAFASAKIVVVQCLAVFMLLVWLANQAEQRFRPQAAVLLSPRPPQSRTAWLTSPLILPALYLALVYVVTSLTSIAPRLSVWGSYQRLEGAYTALSYIVIFLLTATHMRRREQVERLVTAILLASWPVCLFGIAQQLHLDPIPWTGENRPGIFSTAGHPLYLAGYLCMIIPLAFQRLVQVLSASSRGGGRTAGGILYAVSLTALLLLQLLALLLTQSRAPTLGLLAAAGVMFLAWAFLRGRRDLVFTVLVVGLELALLVVLINIPNTPLSSVQRRLAQVPYLGRLSGSAGSGSGTFRLILWDSTATLMGSDSSRLLLGYGPETFGNVVLPYYSPTSIPSTSEGLPERAHNVTLDVLSTTGLLGLVANIVLFCGLFLVGLASLGMHDPPFSQQTRLAALACLLVLGIAGVVAPRIITHTWGLSGLGLSLGLVGGVLVFLVLRVFLWREKREARPASLPLTAALLAALVAHLVDISFAFRLPTTQLYFWLLAAVLARPGWAEADEVSLNLAPPSGLTLGGLLALALTTLAYDFSDPYHLNAPQTAYVGPLLIVLTFVLAGTMAFKVSRGQKAPRLSVMDSATAPWLVAAYLFGAYWLTRLPLEWLNADASALLVHYAIWLFLLVLALGWSQSGARTLRLPALSRVQGGVYGLAGLAVILVVGWNLRPMQADFYLLQGRLAAQAQTWDQSVAYFQRAINLAPNESYYYQQASKAILDRAVATANQTEKDAWFQRGATLLDQARTLAPYSVDPVYNAARYYVTWAQATPSQRLHLERADMALAYCEQTKRMMGDLADIHLTCGLANEVRGNYDQALAEYQRALQLDHTQVQAYVQMGNVYRQQGDIEKAVAEYQNALNAQPALTEASRRLVSLYLEQGDLTAALREAQTAVKRRPTDFEARRDLIGIYVKQGQLKDALREALAAQDVTPPDQRASLAKLIDELKAQQ